jgi:arginine decarboxylase-like protein
VRLEARAAGRAAPDREHDHLIVCNGYKDHEFMRLALMGQKVGHRVFIVHRAAVEVDVLLEVADELGVTPTIGSRIKLATESAGRWAQSAGEKSKFGLNTAQLVKLHRPAAVGGRLDIVKLIHFHLGSQIPDIRYIKAGCRRSPASTSSCGRWASASRTSTSAAGSVSTTTAPARHSPARA